MTRKLLARLAMVVVGFVLALAVAELALRLFPGVLSENARLRLHWAGLGADERTTMAHPTIGYVARPGLEETLERSDLRFHYAIDPNGFRNPWPWPERADVVVTGDSLAFGYGVDDGEGWTDLLQERLPGLSLVNLGITGGAPQMGLAAYEAFGAALHPKVVLFGLFLGNDVYDALKFAQWRASDAGGNFGVWRALGGRAPGLRGTLRGFLNRSYLLAFLRDDLRLNEQGGGQTLELAGGGRVQLVPQTLGGSMVRPGDPGYELVLGAMVQAAERVRADGGQLVVVSFPTKEEVYLFGSPEHGGVPCLLDPFRGALAERGIEVLDLSEKLREGAAHGRQLFFEIDGHPNAEGYAVIADVVAGHLRQNAAAYGLSL